MVKQKKRSSTQWMLEVLARTEKGECLNLPPEFLCGLRGCLEAGLSCEEIIAVLVLFTGVYEAGEKMSGPELVERAKHLASTMKGDICFYAFEREQKQGRNREHARKRKALLANRKR